MAFAYHVTIEATDPEGPPVEVVAEAMHRLGATSIAVDTAGIGRVLLASLQARGLPAVALEKRPRPVLAEVQRIEELSSALSKLQKQFDEQALELKFQREYRRDIQILIGRLDQ